jgi:hypothetical protein
MYKKTTPPAATYINSIPERLGKKPSVGWAGTDQFSSQLIHTFFHGLGIQDTEFSFQLSMIFGHFFTAEMCRGYYSPSGAKTTITSFFSTLSPSLMVT